MPFCRFRNDARRVLTLANQAAQGHNQRLIGTEHILQGLVEEESGKAFQALSALNITRGKISAAIDSVMRSADAPRSRKRLFMRQTSRACKVITNAIKESRKCRPRVLETEHLLLGLLSIPDCTAIRVLKTIDVSPDEVRQKVLNLTKKLEE